MFNNDELADQSAREDEDVSEERYNRQPTKAIRYYYPRNPRSKPSNYQQAELMKRTSSRYLIKHRGSSAHSQSAAGRAASGRIRGSRTYAGSVDNDDDVNGHYRGSEPPIQLLRYQAWPSKNEAGEAR